MVKKRWLEYQFKDYDRHLLDVYSMANFYAAAVPVSATAKGADGELLKCTPSRAKLGSPALSKPTHAVKSTVARLPGHFQAQSEAKRVVPARLGKRLRVR